LMTRRTKVTGAVALVMNLSVRPAGKLAIGFGLAG
jgi:hypothetical protein